jgi:hypothetical protein
MNLPGFTAEASLYKSKESYHQAKIFLSRPEQIIVQDCHSWQEVACEDALTFCNEACQTDDIACLDCLAEFGATDCMDCLE